MIEMTDMPIDTSPNQLDPSADVVIQRVLRAVLQGDPAVVVEAPPGSGKSYLVELTATLACHTGLRVGIACQTVAQTLDLLRRMALAYSDMPIVFLAAGGSERGNVDDSIQLAYKIGEVPDGPVVVVATSKKWSYVNPDTAALDILIVDEAWQLTDASYTQIAVLCDRQMLVGDPGQISPVVSVDVKQWRHSPTGPHRSAPAVLRIRHPAHVSWFQLPVSRRLSADTVSILQPVFYPDLQFESAAPDWQLIIEPGPDSRWSSVFDNIADGRQLALAQLPAGYPGINDPQLVEVATGMIADLLTYGSINRRGVVSKIEATDIAVVCSHRSQVSAVHSMLPGAASEVRVDTAERLQGQETAITIVHHPLSGQSELTEFGRNAGRMCVMLSRHRVGCIVLAREGTSATLYQQGMAAERVLSSEPDSSYLGWKSNIDLLRALSVPGRKVDVPVV